MDPQTKVDHATDDGGFVIQHPGERIKVSIPESLRAARDQLVGIIEATQGRRHCLRLFEINMMRVEDGPVEGLVTFVFRDYVTGSSVTFHYADYEVVKDNGQIFFFPLVRQIA